MTLPNSEIEAAEIIRDHAARRQPLRFAGGATRPGLSLGTKDVALLCSRGISGITLYEPSEMIISARAGTPLHEVEALLSANGQRLTFEPMDHRDLYGTAGEPTIGAVAAANISGPRRIQAGAARDSMIGVRFINGKGDIIRSGGRVMKNVTGLDLVKLQAGALGRLGLLTEITFKVLPRPETSATLVIRGLSDLRAVEALSLALGSPFEVTGAAHRPNTDAKAAETFIRIENVASAVDYRLASLKALLAAFGPMERLDKEASEVLWVTLRDCSWLAEDRAAVIWRVSLKPEDGPVFVDQVSKSRDCRAFYDWGGGLVWLATSAEGEGGADLIRRTAARLGGHARLERAPHELRASVPLLQPLPVALAQLEQGIALSVDPGRIFSAVPPAALSGV